MTYPSRVRGGGEREREERDPETDGGASAGCDPDLNGGGRAGSDPDPDGGAPAGGRGLHFGQDCPFSAAIVKDLLELVKHLLEAKWLRSSSCSK